MISLLTQKAVQLMKKIDVNKNTPNFRIGVSGPPGAGKSSLIEVLGLNMVKKGRKVAVLTVDPSSSEFGGSILGDKTRMPQLGQNREAYVRTSATRGTLGGIARATFDSISICEAAGFDRIIVESVGVGQSETLVANLVDCLLLVLPPHAGDELQIIKKGVTEFCDIVVVNKADGDAIQAAQLQQSIILQGLTFVRRRLPFWKTQVMCCSAHTGLNIFQLEESIAKLRDQMTISNRLYQMRAKQRLKVVKWAAKETVLDFMSQDLSHAKAVKSMQSDIQSGKIPVRFAAMKLAKEFMQSAGESFRNSETDIQ